MRRRKPLALPLATLLLGLAVSTTAFGGATTSTGQTVVIKTAYNRAFKQPIVVDGKGRSVYMFVLDTNGTATCTAQWEEHPLCYKVLPPVTGIPRAGAGIDASKLGTTKRNDGLTQITYNRYPLYYFKGGFGYGVPDKKPGDLNGHGFYGMFYVLSPIGRRLR
jgi:predicted lipoprotein with Yx(FWY)xxD motif